jgi:hypothetical protein
MVDAAKRRSAVNDGPDSVERFSVCDVSLESDHANSVGAAGHDEVNGNTLDLGAVSSAAGPERVNRAVIWHSAKAFLA